MAMTNRLAAYSLESKYFIYADYILSVTSFNGEIVRIIRIHIDVKVYRHIIMNIQLAKND